MCWRDNLGIRECGSVVPPEYSQERIEVLNDEGMVIKVIQPPKSQAELDREAAETRRKKEEQEAKAEQARQDQILLDSYSSVHELIRARDSNLKAIKAQIDIAKSNLEMMQNHLADLQNQAGNYQRDGNQPPKRLIAKIDQAKKRISAKKHSIQQQINNRNSIKERFDRDLTRYRQLTGADNN